MSTERQTLSEVKRIAQDWQEMYAPTNLIRDDRTAALLVEWVLAHEGFVSFSGFNHAVEALGAQVLYQPKVKTADELSAAEQRKQHDDYMRSIAPQPSFEERVKVEADKRAAEKAAAVQLKAKGELVTTIDSYECYMPNGSGRDVSSTAMVKRELNFIKVGNDFVRTLVAVKQVMQELPDHPKLGDVARTVERLNARFKF